MSIAGHGIDLVDVARIERMIGEHGERFLSRCFTAGERAYAESSERRMSEHLAARFAAKEATLKALGTGLRGPMNWTDIEIERDEQGKPTLVLHGEVLKTAAALGVRCWTISLSHTDGVAIASVIGER